MAGPLVGKLQIKPPQKLNVQNVPEGYLDKLVAGLKGIDVATRVASNAEAVLIFVNNLAEAKRLMPRAIKAVKPDGLLWVAYPKGTSKIKTDVNRDTLWAATKETGWRPVRLVAIDDVWSAMRFRPAEKVKKQ